MPMNGAVSDTFKKYSGAVLTGVGALVAVGLLVGVFFLLTKLIPKDGSGSLALLAIGGVVVLILLLTAVAMVFSILQLTNDTQAMGLPEGSIRAVIALSLIVLFAILSVFLYQGVSTGNRNVIEGLSNSERVKFILEHTTAQDIQSKLKQKGADGKEDIYEVSYRSTNATADDFAKQMLVLLGTLMTAVTSFYLGAGTATSAKKVGETEAKKSADSANAPYVSNIDPTSYAATGVSPMKLQLTGTNLDSITSVKIARAGVEVPGTIVSKTATSLTCEIPVSAATTPPGLWALVVDDGGSKSFTRNDALTITA